MAHHDFVEGVRRTAGRHGMDLSRPLVLVSGGPDSVALLRAILELGGDPAVLHVDHGLRGEGSRADAAFVMDLCGTLGVRCEVEVLDLGGASNLQERAREARYRLAREVAGRLGLGVVATGHTVDDVAETAILNLSRGAGLRGLASIPPARDILVRPLIDRTRREVLLYLSDLAHPSRTDQTNLSAKYARNRVRLEVLPALEARGAEVVVSRETLLSLPPALRRHAVRRAYARVLPGAPPPELRHVESVLALAGPGTRSLDLPGGLMAVWRGGEEIAFYVPGEVQPGEKALREGEVAFGGWVFLVREVGRYDGREAAQPGVAYLDGSGGPYHVRTAREGDMIRPLGLGGRKKVFRAMMDRKVPRDLRRLTPVVVGRTGEVAWIPFGELGEGFEVGGETGRILKVEVSRRP